MFHFPIHHNNIDAANQRRRPLLFFFFNDTATTEIYTLSLHDALPISWHTTAGIQHAFNANWILSADYTLEDRKSTRLNSSHLVISYAVFCLKKKSASTKSCSPASLNGSWSSALRNSARSISISERYPL